MSGLVPSPNLSFLKAFNSMCIDGQSVLNEMVTMLKIEVVNFVVKLELNARWNKKYKILELPLYMYKEPFHLHTT